MAGALAGALNGFDKVPNELFQEVKKTNSLGLEETAAGLEQIARKNLQKK
jgi:ADP-ribosylglycohydrolase